jgi:DHA1 family multidrug resistance protein-like MFS transporter
MSKKQLATLFLCNLVPWTAGNGLVPLLPVYATQLGADSAVSGYYLAFSYLAIALGALSAGWVSDRFQRRKLPLILAGIVGIPAAWLMGQTASIWGLTILTAILWFCGGLGLALIGILTGLSAGEHERGKVFGILALTGGLGAVIGGLGTGWLVEGWGFTAMFTGLAFFLVLWPVSALLLEEKETPRQQSEGTSVQKQTGLGKSFYLLFTANILSSIAGFFIVLIRSLAMNDLGFNSLEIASTGVVGGLIAMPLPMLMGWLSDRLGRKAFLYIGYLVGLMGLIVLAFSQVIWQFWLVLVLQGIATGNGGTVGNAVVTDLLPREALGKGLALFGSTGWIGGVIGFAVAGAALQNFGYSATIILGGCLALCAVGLLIPVKVK